MQEGDDVYFDCEVEANPRVHEIVWKHGVRRVISQQIQCQQFMLMHDVTAESPDWIYRVPGNDSKSEQPGLDHERGQLDHPASFKRVSRYKPPCKMMLSCSKGSGLILR